MKSKLTLVFSSVIFIAGIVIGASIGSWSAISTITAGSKFQNVSKQYDRLASNRDSLVQGSDLLATVSKLTTPSVVHIQSTRYESGRGRVEETGSGIIMKSSRSPGFYVVTNRHVVHDSRMNDIGIHLQDGRTINPVKVWEDRATDVAVLKVSVDNLQAGRWGNSDQVKIGHMVLAMGSPFGLSQSVTMGIIGAKGRRSLQLGKQGAVLNQDFLQTDAAINPGNSGGPLIDLHGRVIGINTAIASNGGGNDGIAFSIPSNLVKFVMEELIKNGKVKRAYLGVKLNSNFSVRLARKLKLSRNFGAHVTTVYPETPASEARLKVNDVILAFNGIEVEDENHLINLVSLTPIGSTATLTIWRSGEKRNVKVHLADRVTLPE